MKLRVMKLAEIGRVAVLSSLGFAARIVKAAPVT